MIEFAEDDDDAPAGLPAWIATFADLMTLLMSFFVLLLSFSEMDAQKYKLVAGSMKNAFGIQRDVLAIKNPSGSSEFLEDFQQQDSPVDQSETNPAEADPPEMDPAEFERDKMLEQIEDLVMETERDIEKLRESLKKEIEGGFIELESGFRSIVIRIKEKGSFDSGSADLQQEFIPVMAKMQEALNDIEGKITVEGHTDNIDISTPRFASNWALSSARALSVGHALLRDNLLDSSRFVISGFSDTIPFSDNDTPEGRTSNRRVEIKILQPISAEIGAAIRALSENDSELLELLNGTSIDEITVQ